MAAGQRLVAYERVSTARQGASGLGLEAQRKVIEDFAASRGAEVLARFMEVESGRKADRPELAKALHLAKVTGATLVIAKLDRLSRNAALFVGDSGQRREVRRRRHAAKPTPLLECARRDPPALRKFILSELCHPAQSFCGWHD
jgi:Resolvase, N terminal domain